MRKRKVYRLLSVLLILSLLFVTSCGGGGGGSTPPDNSGNSDVSSLPDRSDISEVPGGDQSDVSEENSDSSTNVSNSSGDSSDTTGTNAVGTGNQSATQKTTTQKTTTEKTTTQNTTEKTTTQNTTEKTTTQNTTADSNVGVDAIDYTVGTKPAKRATKINGFVRRAGKYLIDEAGDEWFVKGGGIDNGSLAGKFESNETYCDEAKYKEHVALGCNTIRLTFNWEIFIKSRSSSQFRETGFEWLEQQVEWAKKYNMRLILNMHRIPCGDAATGNVHTPHIFWNKTYQQQWKAVWREIARRFADEPVILAYSMWNEQNAPYMDEGADVAKKVYGDLYQECIDVIRTVDKNHMIVCEQVYNLQEQNGSVTPISYPAFPFLKEKNIMYEYHNYYPYDFTYQKVGGNMVVYGTTANYDTIWANHKPYARYRDDNNVPVFCGEWGAYYDAYRAGTNAEQWADDMMKVMKDLEMQFTIHTPFAMYSKALQPWHYSNGTPTWGGPEYTILEDAFKRYMPTL